MNVKITESRVEARARSQARMDALRRDDETFNRTSQHDRSEGLTARVDIRALANAVKREGHGILTREGQGFWRDMVRRYPHLKVRANGPSRLTCETSLNGRSSRYGKARLRKRASGPWEQFVGGRWIPAEA